MLFHKGKRKKLEVRGKFQKEEGEDPDNDTSSDEEVRMPTKKEPFVKQRKSIRLASSVLWLVQMMTPPNTPPVSLNRQLLHQNLMHLFLVDHHQPPHLTHHVLVLLILLIPQFLSILYLINYRFFSVNFILSKIKCASSLHHSLISLHKWRLVSVPSLTQWMCKLSIQTKMNLLFDPSPYYIFLMMLFFIKQTIYLNIFGCTNMGTQCNIIQSLFDCCQ